MLNVSDKFFTILICCYNAEETLSKCLESLVCQKASSVVYKILFINDGSTDNSFEIAKSYSEMVDNFTIHSNNHNQGLVFSCNKAIDILDTSFFMRLDADDYIASNAIEKIAEEIHSLKDKNFIVFKRWDTLADEFKEVEINNDIYSWIAAGTVFDTGSVREVGAYSDVFWEEYDLYIKLLEAGNKYKISPYRIYYYCRGNKSMTEDKEKKRQGFNVLQKKWGDKTLKKYGNFIKILEYY